MWWGATGRAGLRSSHLLDPVALFLARKGEWMRYTVEIDDVIFGHFNAKDWEHALKKTIYFWPSETRLALRISLIWDKGEGDLIETTEK